MDLSSTHDRIGPFWVPRTQADPVEPAVAAALDDLDIPALHARIVRAHAFAASRLDSPSLSADERQYWAGAKNAHAQDLRLFEPTPGARLTAPAARPEGEPEPAVERARTGL